MTPHFEYNMGVRAKLGRMIRTTEADVMVGPDTVAGYRLPKYRVRGW